MRALDMSGVQEAGTKLPAGGYVCVITNVADYADKEYIKIEYDILEGPFARHFQRLAQGRDYWPGNFIKSYKESALPFFKSFLKAVKLSNDNFPYDGNMFSNEHSLTNMRIGLVLGDEQYRANDGAIKTRLYVYNVQTVQSIRDGKFSIPELKPLSEAKPKTSSGNPSASGYHPTDAIDDDDLPF